MRSKIICSAVLLTLAAMPLAAQHRSGGGHRGGRSAHPRSNRSHRSEAAKGDFMRRTGHPHGWPGHVVDHIVPLACGGADAPSNMQWQTTEEAKAKDRVERRGCGRTR
jgi:hypothetical protein